MFSAKRTTLTSVVTLAALSWASSVTAEELSVSTAVPAADATPLTASLSSGSDPAPSEAAIIRRNPFGSKPMAAAALAARRGGDRVFNEAQLKGVVADNQAINVSTGMNVIGDGAFAGSAGLSTVVQNSGNNVLIQNATIVNIQLK